MNAEMEEKLRLACVDAADAFELVPETFCTYAYAKNGDQFLLAGRGSIINRGDTFCALGALSYLSGYTVHAGAEFLYPSLRILAPLVETLDPEGYNNEKGREAVIRLLRHAAIRTVVAISKAE